MSTIGMITNPDNGYPVLVIKQTTSHGKVWMDRGQPVTKARKPTDKPNLRKTTLRGNVGDVFNYVTLKNYGKRDIIFIS